MIKVRIWVKESRRYAQGQEGWVCNRRLDLRTSPPHSVTPFVKARLKPFLPDSFEG